VVFGARGIIGSFGVRCRKKRLEVAEAGNQNPLFFVSAVVERINPRYGAAQITSRFTAVNGGSGWSAAAAEAEVVASVLSNSIRGMGRLGRGRFEDAAPVSRFFISEHSRQKRLPLRR